MVQSLLRYFILGTMMLTATVWATAPTISSTSPATNNLHVTATANITITFNQSMDNATLTSSTIKVQGNYRGYYSGSFSYGANSTTFNPDSSFKPGEIITVSVTTGVQNAGNESMTTPRVFDFTVDATLGYAKYKSPANYTVNAGANGNYSSVIADLDGDGDLDIATTATLYNQLSVFMNNGNGSFATAVNYTTLTALDVKAADVDGDGDMDLVTANNNAHGVSVFVNDAGIFTRTDIDFLYPQSNSGSVVVVDMDGDGDVDIVASDLTYNRIHVLINSGSAAFTPAAYSTTLVLSPLTFGDLDKDGDMDIVGSNGSVDSVEFFRNDGTGALALNTRFSWPNGTGYNAPLIADINSTSGDKMDLIYANANSNNITYFEDQSGVALFKVDSVAVGGYPASIAAVDVDTDNDLDLLVANYNDATFSLLSNNGSGVFSTTHTYAVSSYPNDIHSGDLNGDGAMDIVTSNNDGKISVLLNYNGGHVASVTPVNGLLNTDSTTNIVIVFDENINSGTLTSSTVKIIGSVSGIHSWTLSSYNSGTYTATFDPNVNFKPGEVVTVTVSTGVQNGNSIALEKGYSSAFIVKARNTGGVFGTKTDYSSGSQTQAVITADLNADGYADIATANYADNNISVFINNGDGTYASAVNYTAGTGPTSVAAGDIDGDGDIDLVVALNGEDKLAKLLNNGSGVFGAATTYSTSANPYAIVLADVDGDGDLDAVYTRSSPYLQVMTQQNSGSGVFSNEYGWSSGEKGVTLADVDNDGNVDIIATSYSGFVPRVYVYKNGYNASYGWGYFSNNSNYDVDADPTGVVAADFNGDGYIDVVSANLAGGNGTISYLQNNQSGGFNSQVSYGVGAGSQPRGVIAKDIDGDGDLDLIVANGSGNSAVVFTNNGSGAFTKTGEYTTGGNPYAIASADVDGDGDVEIVTANYTGNSISVLMNTKQVQISSLSPTVNAVNASASSNVVITFNQPMNSGTLTTSTIKVSGSIHGNYSGSVSYNSGTHAATFDPASNFKAGENITVLVTTGVQNVDGAALPSSYQWSFVVAASAEGTFGGKQNYTLTGNPIQSVTADLNGDGFPDVVSTSTYWDEANDQSLALLEVTLNNGLGVLGASDTTHLGTDIYPRYLVVSDVDADGDLDVIIANQNSNSFFVVLNNGNATFAAPVEYAFADPYPTLAVADLNNDGYNDLVLTKNTSNQAVVYLNNGSGTFIAQSPLTTGTGPWGVSVGDIDGDGDIDILIPNYDEGTISIFKNNGNGTFASAYSVSPGISSPDGIAVGDLDGDGDADLAVSSWDSGTSSVLLNQGTGTFSSATVYSNDSPSQTKLADMDGDGDLDIVTSEPGINKIYIRANNGSGTFSEPAAYTAGSYPQSIALADMEGDGDLDIVTANNGESNVSIIKNIELVKVNSFSPTANAINVDTASNITVTFNVDMNSATLVDSTVIVHGSTTGTVMGVISYDSPSKTMTFNPVNGFLAGEEISLTLTANIKNTNGINLHSASTNTFTAHSAGTGNFVFKDSIADYPDSYNYMSFINSGDVTGDGKTDLLGASSTNIKVFKNNSPTFDSISTVSVSYPQDVQMADLDNDGDLDMVQLNYSNSYITSLINDGAGNFTAQTPVNVGINYAPRVVLKDMDNDGKIDVTMNGSGSQQVYVFHNDGTGAFSNSNYSYVTIHYDIKDYTCADVDNDGKNDIITVHSGNGNNFVTISRNTGDRTFATPVDYTISQGATKMTAADVNGDGCVDILVGNSNGMFFSVLLNNGDGTFASAVDYNIGMNISELVSADVDGDGDVDLLVRGSGYNPEWNGDQDKLIIAYNNGSGNFGNQSNIDIKSGDPQYYYGYSNMTLLDIDNDGDLDLAVHAGHYVPDQYENILLFENTSGSISAPTTAATTITTSNNYGTSVKVNWTNGNGSHRLVLVKQGSAVNATPSDNGTFNSNAQLGSGTQVGSGNYTMFDGVGSSVTVTGLSLSTTYYVSIFEANGSPGHEQFLLTSPPTASFTTSQVEGYPYDTTAGNAVSFNGSSSSVEMSFPDNLPDNFTVEMWVKVSDSSSIAPFFVREDGSGGGGGGDIVREGNLQKKSVRAEESSDAVAPSKIHNTGHAKRNHSKSVNPSRITSASDATYNTPIQIGINNGHFYASVYDDDNEEPINIVGTSTINSDQWYHVSFTQRYNSNSGESNFHFYLNGAEEGDSATVGYYNDRGDAFILGTDGSAYFDGQIDEVQIRNSVQSVSQIRSSMHRTVGGFPTDMIGYWQFNEGTGTTSAEILNGNDALLTDINWVSSAAPIGHGVASSISSFTTGQQTAGNATLNMTDGFDNPVDVVVSEVSAAPNVWPDGYSVSVGGKIFVIELYGDPGTFTANLTLNFGANGVTPTMESTPSTVKLFKRSSTSSGSWTDLGGAVYANASTGDVRWEGITSFSQFMGGDVNNPLPVTLASLNGVAMENGVKLTWSTATELNNYGFEVQRGTMDAKNNAVWNKVGFVEGNGTSNAPKQYSFTDNNLVRGKYSYRLKQIDRDGKFSYSKVVEVSIITVPKVFALDQNYPNPFNPSTTIRFTIQQDGLTSLIVYNTLGQKVATLVNELLKAGEYHEAHFNGQNLASGIYFARLVSGNNVQVKKMMLLK